MKAQVVAKGASVVYRQSGFQYLLASLAVFEPHAALEPACLWSAFCAAYLYLVTLLFVASCIARCLLNTLGDKFGLFLRLTGLLRCTGNI